MSAGRFSCPRRAEVPSPEGSDHWRDGGEHWGAAWPEGYDKPRICSHCGSVHPDDAVLLLADGWTFELTDARYMFYLNPDADTQKPSPRVRIYIAHWAIEDVLRACEVIRVRRLFMTAAQPTQTN